MRSDFIFTSESVTEGHPDKLCDVISDAVVDRFLRADPYSRINVECAVATGILFIAARFASRAVIDIPQVAREVISEVGYEGEGFDARNCSVMTSLKELPQSEYDPTDEATLDDAAIERRAVRNQVTVFGYACTQTPSFMPLPIALAHRLARRLATVRITRELAYLSPDGKTQVAVEYRDRRAHRIHGITVIAAVRPDGAPTPSQLQRDLLETVIEPVFAHETVRPDAKTRIFVNPGGPFLIGGPALHSGLTGRKNGVDTYGEFSRHSGAALSGKDPTRIDRVGAYAARHAARAVVAAGLAPECEIQLSYSIGQSRPVSIQVETFGTGAVADDEIARRIEQSFDFRLAAIIARFDLRRMPSIHRGQFYRRLAAYGHMGRMDIGLPWESSADAAAQGMSG